jgi:hypothetical protein
LNILFFVIIAIYIALFVFCIRRGMQKGAVNELRTMLTMICAAATFELAASVVKSRATGNVSGMFVGILLLVVVSAAFSVFHTLFGMVHLFSRLPVIRVVDNLLGIVFGAVTACVTAYLVDALLRYFVVV